MSKTWTGFWHTLICCLYHGFSQLQPRADHFNQSQITFFYYLIRCLLGVDMHCKIHNDTLKKAISIFLNVYRFQITIWGNDPQTFYFIQLFQKVAYIKCAGRSKTYVDLYTICSVIKTVTWFIGTVVDNVNEAVHRLCSIHQSICGSSFDEDQAI